MTEAEERSEEDGGEMNKRRHRQRKPEEEVHKHKLEKLGKEPDTCAGEVKVELGKFIDCLEELEI